MEYIEVSTMIGCKNNCSFCPQQKIIKSFSKNGGTPLQPMDLSLYKKCVDKIPTKTSIVFSGMCEPWLNPNCSKMITYAYKKGHIVRAYTTLVGMEIKDIKILKKINFPNDEHGFIIHLPSINNLENISVDSKYMALLDAICNSSIPIQFHYHGEALPKVLQEFFSKHKAIISIFPAHTRAGNTKDGNKLNRRRGVIGCKKMKLYGSYGPILLPDGTMILCCQDYCMKHILGNLSSQTFEEIANSPELTKIKEGLKDEKKNILCRSCEYAYNVNWKAKLLNNQVFLPDHIK